MYVKTTMTSSKERRFNVPCRLGVWPKYTCLEFEKIEIYTRLFYLYLHSLVYQKLPKLFIV